MRVAGEFRVLNGERLWVSEALFCWPVTAGFAGYCEAVMTETIGVAGRKMLSGVRVASSGGAAEIGELGETGLVDRLIDLVLAIEPLELKQTGPADLEGEGTLAADGGGGAPTLVSDSTPRMLMQMRAVLDREAARLGTEGAEGKAAVDQVALIARTLEKIDQMERLIAQDQARAERETLSAGEREQLRQTVRQLILAAAERLAAERERGNEHPVNRGGAQQ